ncbi:MAG TPA: hypothetical protein VFR28_05725 [Allosphingosinicella sp.]|jgi:hypothetical protein|nr:hypothetical protein [Allosphingosinicella sp.]
MSKSSDDILGPRERAEPEAQTGRKGGGQAGGGAYPNPHTGKEEKGDTGGGFMGHGGQTEMPYHGSGQLGEQQVGGNENAPASKTRPGEKDDHKGD